MRHALWVCLMLALPVEAAGRLKVGYFGLTAGAGVDAEQVKAISEALHSELSGIGAYDVIARSDIEAMLGLERQRQLLGCSDESASCMAEIADALNTERIVSGTVARVDDRVTLAVSLIDPKRSRVLHRASRIVDSTGALVDEVRPVAYELVNADEAFSAAPFKLERGFGGVMLGLRGDVDLLGPAVAPGITVELSAKRWFGGALTVLPKAIPGVRLEARFYPLTANRVRLWLAAGVSAFTEGVGPRGGAGASVRIGQLHVFADAGYEYFFPLKPAVQRHAIVIGLGLGWLF